MSKSSAICLRITRNRRLAEDWQLVLVAEGLSPSVVPIQEGIAVVVPKEEAEPALAALAAYDKENSRKSRKPNEPIGPTGLISGVIAAGAVLAFFFVTVAWMPTVPWFERGGADADRITHGEVWRTVTALTLHSDIVHALSNALAAAVFFGAVFGLLGPGLGLALVLLAGAGGNFANAVLYGSHHLSVGLSTSVFAAVGVLGGLGILRYHRNVTHKRKAWLPIAAAFAILAMLGSGGERVDVWAHLCGLLFGGVSGIATGLISPHAPQKLWVQWACGGTTLVLLIYCWILALR
ncbi:MAG: rhomboid family intramembrane serine protease [Alphaproteobacteria bacterium]